MNLTRIDTKTSGYGREILEIVDRLSPSVVCFDYFDTLVHRNVAPEDVKRIVCERVARIANSADSSRLGSDLYALRQQVELDACNENASQGFDQEFSLPDAWYSIWDAEPKLHSLSRDSFVDIAMRLELAVECNIQYVDEEMRALVQALAEKNIRLALISDFYLPAAYYKLMLDHHGLDTLFSSIHISSDGSLTKRSGRLFSVVSNQLNTPLEAMLMIGDNPYSDAEIPVSLGMPAVHLDRSHHYERYQRLSVASIDYGAIEHELERCINSRASPFTELAMTLYLFIDDLYHALQRAGAKDVFFMAREGQFLKQLFDHYQAQLNIHASDRKNTRIRSHYFRVSRRSTFLPSLRPLDNESFTTLFRQYRRISPHEFLASIGLEDTADEIAAELPYDLSTRLEDLPTSEEFSTLLANNIFRHAYETARVERLKAFLAYLESFDSALGDNDEIHFVDVGWKGTIQDNIRNIFDQLPSSWANGKITGHYLGLIAPGAISERNTKSGIIFNSVGGISKNFHVFNENRALFEIALGADHGSAYAYDLDENGSPCVIEGNFDERELFEQKIQPLQTHLLEVFQAIQGILAHSHLPHYRLAALATRMHARMMFMPTLLEIHWFEGVYHVENFGMFESSRFTSNISKPSLLDTARFYWKLRTTPETADLGFWPWLRCYQQGGRLVAWRYAQSQLKIIEK